MSYPLHVQERDRLLAALRGLSRRVTLAGRPTPGFAADPGPGAPIRALDNAIAAEALAIPVLRDADPALAATPLAFLAALAAAGGARDMMPRAVAMPVGRVAIRRAEAADFRVLTPWHVLTGDLTRGIVRQALRGEEEPGRTVQHTGNLVRLRPGGLAGLVARLGLASPALDVEDRITGSGVVQEGRGALLFHESALRHRFGVAGTIRYEYRVSADDPVLRVTVTLRPPSSRTLPAARVTTALDALSELRPPMRGAALLGAGDAVLPGTGPEGPWRGEMDLGSPAGLEILHLRTTEEPEPLSLLLRPGAPAALHSIRATGNDDALHWVVLRHALPAGGAATVTEDRLLLRGALPDSAGRAARRLREPAAGDALDAGLTDDPVLLAAVAGALAAGAPVAAEVAGTLLAWLTGAVDAGLSRPGTPPPALILAAERLWRAGADPSGERLRHAAPRLRIAEDGLAMLVAARLSPWSPEAAAALRDGVATYPETPEGLFDRPTVELAALLRGFRAAARAEALPDDLRPVAEAWAVGCLDALGARLRARGDVLEVAPGPDAEPGEALPVAALLLAVLGEEEGG